MRQFTAKAALSEVLAAGWQSDALAEDAAVEAMKATGWSDAEARLMVRKEIKRLQVFGSV